MAKKSTSKTKTKFASVDAYIAAQPLNAKLTLTRVRNILRKALPGAEEVISYDIPAYRLPDGLAVFFAGWRQHFSLYPASDKVVEAFKKELKPFEVSRGTIRFPLHGAMPVDLIAGIAKLRAKEISEKASETKKAVKKAAPKQKVAAKKASAKKPAKKAAKKTAKAVAKKAAKKR